MRIAFQSVCYFTNQLFPEVSGDASIIPHAPSGNKGRTIGFISKNRSISSCTSNRSLSFRNKNRSIL